MNWDIYLKDSSILYPDIAAAAILVAPGQRYILQLRDDKPGIFFPGFWGCFGGAIEPDDTGAEGCVIRELREELGLALERQDIAYFMKSSFDYTFCGLGTIERIFFEVRLDESQLRGLRLGEGSAVRAFGVAEALSLVRVAPYDAFALWSHANRGRMRAVSEDC